MQTLLFRLPGNQVKPVWVIPLEMLNGDEGIAASLLEVVRNPSVLPIDALTKRIRHTGDLQMRAKLSVGAVVLNLRIGMELPLIAPHPNWLPDEPGQHGPVE
jgi:hypothetical protein